MPKRRRDATRLGGTRAPKANPHVAVRRELSSRHPRLARLCALAHPLERIIPDKRPLSHLVVRTVVAQLVSTAAARSIMKTLLDAHGDIDGIIAWAMRTPADAPVSHSLSRAKRKAIAHWGFFLAEHGDPRRRWRNLTADELIAEIVALRGLGPWSAHMIAIFGFGHPRIWPDGDAGVVRAAAVVFKGLRKPAVRKLIEGHESHVALCCWAVLDKGRLAEFDA
jgi:DNA-3-methyladenine glycosylase II